MYEIWLVMNILWELALSIWPVLLLLALVWGGLLVFAGIRRGCWLAGFKPALTLGALTGVLAFFLVPSAVQSSLANMDYWVDWANLLAVSGGFAVAMLVFVWPLFAGLRPRAQA